MLWLISEMWGLLLLAFIFGVAAGAWIAAARKRQISPADDRSIIEPRTPASAVAPATLLLTPDGPPDDLTQIIGVDPATERRLNALGVFHLRQIAAWDEGAARWIEIRLNEPGRVARERWVEQASSLA